MAELHPWDQNPRTISPERLENLRRAITADPDFLRLRPILARRSDGSIYCGNQRYLAAVANGATAVPAVVEDVDERTMRERAIRDNEQWGEWSDGLGAIVQSLQRDGSDIGLLGLESSELDKLLAGLAPAVEPWEDVALEEGEPVTHAGDVWSLGDHRLICGDATRPETYEQLLGRERVEIIWTDPPYGVSYVGGTKLALTMANDDERDTYALLVDAFSALDRHLVPGAPIYIASPAGRQGVTFALAFRAMTGWLLHQTLVWLKDRMVLGHSDYHYQHEALLYGWKRGAERPWFGGRDATSLLSDRTAPASMKREELLELVAELKRAVPKDVREADRPSQSSDHPTMKPLELIEPLLLNSSSRGAIVLDAFAGSGSTLLAAERTGRRCRAIELDPRYCDVVVRRWEAMTGRSAVAAAELVA